ncbi:Cache domain-containing protein [Alkalithermobacter thermoalcaliphilus JW-YL-7 = DSM 7308]|uniref:Cache domain-containing protein n=1 Tax=Alkalithermobacter thermoalcaliphilus JW-YL-7 = DSM 7308 TaxID=1121328 RepID=A0A150FSV8_CLOPD|nr:Cache domain containing protein [[Clostridium] paradoxum JW-YL-7 = DSM 7308]SHL33759.1 Cache domain-containing protein [[Clostridium] paradoxum JW-YL-7 = DSM 7308]
MKKTSKLRIKLTIIFILISLIPVITTAFILINNSKNLIEQKMNNLTKQISTEKVAYIDSLIQVSETAIQSITKDENILSGNTENIFSILSNYNLSNPNFFQSYIGKQDKEFIITPKRQMPEGYDPTQRPWYIEATNNFGNVIITKPYQSSSTGYMMVTVAKAFKLSDGTQAVAGIDITLETLIDHIAKTRVGETGYTVLLQEDGTIIAHPNEQLVMTNIADEYEFGKEVISQKSGNLKYTTDRESKISGFDQSSLTNWIVLSSIVVF